MMWGKEKSNHWFFSMILTFSQDTFINQPTKVLLLSTAYAIFVRKSDEESEGEQSNEDPRKGERLEQFFKQTNKIVMTSLDCNHHIVWRGANNYWQRRNTCWCDETLL